MKRPLTDEQKRNKEIFKNLRKRRPETWAEAIELIPQNVRHQAAKIVWWDYFGDRSVANRWPHLDQYLGISFEEAPFADLVNALESVGYPEKTALSRATNPMRSL